MKNFFCSHDLNFRIRIIIIGCEIFPVVSYRAKALTLTEAKLERVEASKYEYINDEEDEVVGAKRKLGR